ncbi:AMP-binding protein [Chitinimonas sp.]|uniref:AMP-binding protein n=1 Tax=Chitinimonas sp. TaxID=1934313 RepID=UPI002F91D246
MADFIALDQLLAKGRPIDHPIALRAGTVLDFAGFSQMVSGWYGAFAADPGQRYALYFEDCVEFAAALFGAWQAGKQVYLPSDLLPATAERLRREVDGFAGDIPDSLPQVRAGEPRQVDWQPLPREALALTVYTSGTTGLPSAIPKRLAQLFDEVLALATCFDERAGESVVLATVSHQHIYGLLFRVLWPLASGRPFAAQRLLYPEDMVAAMTGQTACVLVASPAHLKRLPAGLPWGQACISLRAVFSSGGPLLQEALTDSRALLGQAPLEVYGSSETGGIAWRQRRHDTDAAWQLLPGVQVRVEGGALAVCSPHLAQPGWQTTSDRVRLTEQGFELLGRADRIVKLEEKRVSLSAVEAALLATGLLAEARLVVREGARSTLAVLGVPTEQGWALLEAEGKRALSQRLRTALASELEASVLPRHWRYLWRLPLNAQGKTTDEALRALLDPRRPTVRCLSVTDNTATLRLYISPELPYFDGHFPGSPILPGVAQLEWVVRLGQECFSLPAHFLRMDAVKFQQLIQPGQMLELLLGYQRERATLSFTMQSPAGVHASGRLVFGHPA